MHTCETARLELRWRNATDAEKSKSLFGTHVVACDYGLVIPLGEHDIRRDIYHDGEETGETQTEVFYVFRTTLSSGGNGVRTANDPPFRDAAHAQWDAKVLGNLPIFCVGTDGARKQYQPKVQP